VEQKLRKLNNQNESSMKDFITIATFTFPADIVVLKSILDAEGIAYFFRNETAISIDPLASIAYGGIHLKVHPNDTEIVLKIIEDLNEKTNLRKID
jgi:hypothetical protein